MSYKGHKTTVTDNCPLARYIHRLGKVGDLVELSSERAALVLGIQRHTVHSEIRDLRATGMIQAEPDGRVGAYLVRILR